MYPVLKLSKKDLLYNYSDPIKVQQKAFQYYGNDAIVYKSSRKNKKYMIQDKQTGKFIHFGQLGYEDGTKSPEKRERYLARATKIKGNWKNNPYSPNNLSINLLW